MGFLINLQLGESGRPESDWRKILECKSCGHQIDAFASKFLVEVCPKCGFEDYKGRDNIWQDRKARLLREPSIWWKPSTWNNATIEFDDGEKRIIKRGKLVEVVKSPEEI